MPNHTKRVRQALGTGKGKLRVRQRQAIESGKGKPDYTETTTQTTSNITQEREGLAYASSHSKNIYEGNSDSSLESSCFTHTEPAGAEIIDAETVFNGQQRVIASGSATPLSADFCVTDEMRAWAVENNPEADVDASTKMFKLYHKNTRRADWLTVWQMWILRERPRSASKISASEDRVRQLEWEAANLDKLFADITD